jgi:hypothetical protein
VEFGARLFSADSNDCYLEGLALLGSSWNIFGQFCISCLLPRMLHFRFYRTFSIPNYHTQTLYQDIWLQEMITLVLISRTAALRGDQRPQKRRECTDCDHEMRKPISSRTPHGEPNSETATGRLQQNYATGFIGICPSSCGMTSRIFGSTVQLFRSAMVLSKSGVIRVYPDSMSQ